MKPQKLALTEGMSVYNATGPDREANVSRSGPP